MKQKNDLMEQIEITGNYYMNEVKKVLIAIDSYKGSMSSLEAGNAAKEGILKKNPNLQVVVKALADGGEGTYATLVEAMGGKHVAVPVQDPLGRKINAHYGILADGKTAVMEMAQSSGLTLLAHDERNPRLANTYGFGQMLINAYERGCREFIIGIGGSATTEAGIGMLGALGYRFLDAKGNELPLTIEAMDKITSIDDSLVNKEILQCQMHVACDVTNPLCGENGAVFVYGPQKGVLAKEREELDQKLYDFSLVAEEYAGKKKEYAGKMQKYAASLLPGAGAAGGLGFAFSNFFANVDMRSGADIVIDYLNIEKEVADADLVITGEGRLDGQTASGKGPMKLATLARKYGCAVYAFAGCLGDGVEECNSFLDGYFVITPEDMPSEEAMKKENAIANMILAVENSGICV